MKAKILPSWFAIAVLLGGAVAFLPQAAEAQQRIAARCGKCGRDVPLSSQVGDTCPYCGARWGSEQDSYVSGSAPTPNYANLPHALSLGQMARQQAMMRQAVIEQARMRQQMLEQQRAARRQALCVRCEEQRAKDDEQREAVWARLREEAEYRKREDPQARAKRYRESAAKSEAEGNLKAAVAYYHLIVRSSPETPAASEAKTALERLGAD